jgi:hypothetical protein
MKNVTMIAMLTLALMLPAAVASAAETLTGEQIRETVSDHTVSGSMLESGPYAEFYQADGMIKGDGYTGSWSIADDSMCFEYSGESAGCWQVGMEDGKLLWIQDGEVLGDGTPAPGNPNGF